MPDYIGTVIYEENRHSSNAAKRASERLCVTDHAKLIH